MNREHTSAHRKIKRCHPLIVAVLQMIRFAFISFLILSIPACAYEKMKSGNKLAEQTRQMIESEIASQNLLGEQEESASIKLKGLGFNLSTPRERSSLRFRPTPAAEAEDLGLQDHMIFSSQSYKGLVKRIVSVVVIFENDIIVSVRVAEEFIGM